MRRKWAALFLIIGKMAAEKKRQPPANQLLMYPKDLIYPDGEEAKKEFCPEELRATRPRYDLSPSRVSPDCDMDMTEAFYGNITMNVPVVASIDKGREVLHLLDRQTDVSNSFAKQDLAVAESFASASEVEGKENLPISRNQFDFTPSAYESYSSSSYQQYSFHTSSVVKGALSFSEAESVCHSEDGRGGGNGTKALKENVNQQQERQQEQLKLIKQLQYAPESASTKFPCAGPPPPLPQDSLSSFSVYNDSQFSVNQSSVGSAPQQSAPLPTATARVPLQVLSQDFVAFEDETSINLPRSKQSAPPPTRPPLQVLPQDKSLSSFSVYEEPSISQSYSKQPAIPATRVPLQVLPQDKSSFMVYEEPSINQSSYQQPAPPPTRPPLQVLPQDKSLSSFSVYEEPSINQPHSKQSSAASSRVPLQVLPQDKSSFMVYEEPSINQPSYQKPVTSAPPARPPLQVLPQDKSLSSFSVYEEPSINQPHSKQPAPPPPPTARAPLQLLSQDKSSFIVHDKLSSLSLNQKPHVAPSVRSDYANALEMLSNSKNASNKTSSSCLHHPLKLSAPVSDQPSLPALPPSTLPPPPAHSFPVPVPPPSARQLNPLVHPSVYKQRNIVAPPTDDSAGGVSPESHDLRHVNETIDPSFLIPGCQSDDPTSTPFGKRVGLALIDITAIQSNSPPSTKNGDRLQPLPLPAPSLPPRSLPLPQTEPPSHPPVQPYSFGGQHLDPIQEESRSYYSSSSGSTCSSKNLSTHSNVSRSSNNSQHICNEDEEPPEVQDLRSCGVMNSKRQVNPFTQKAIQFMLQSLPISVTPIHRSPKSCPSMTTGHTIMLADGSSCNVIGKLAKGGFASVYNVKVVGGDTKALKIQNPPCRWEVAITEELHKRLKANDLLQFSHSFMSVDALHLYTNSSVIVYNYYPHGTLLDLVNTCRTTIKKLTEVVLLYYALEICQLVEALHSCGIIHADIKPDNIMLRDIRPVTDYSSIRGRGVCLLDFGRAIDVQSFPRGTQFIGSCGTDSFQCTQMLNQEPWSWHTDLHGIAGTVHVLLHLDYMEVTKNSITGRYAPNKTLPRNYDRTLWLKFFTDLLNWSGETQPDLKSFTQPLMKKLSLNMSHLKLNLNFMWTQIERQREKSK